MAGALYRGIEASRTNKRERYQQLRDALVTERSTFDSHWKDIADVLVPTRSRFFASQRNQGGKRNQNILDSSARFAWRTLRSGMHAGITSPARPWFKLTTPDPELAKFKPVQQYLDDVAKRMQVIFASTNLYKTLPTLYGDLGGFGTGAMSLLEDSKDLFRARDYPIGSYALGMSARGTVNTFVRTYELSVLQVVEEFGVRPGQQEIDWSNISTTVRTLFDRANYTAPVEVCWIVAPNLEADEDRIEAKYLPFGSCHFETGSDKNRGDGRFLRESGFNEFPIMAPRWEVTGEDTYGTDCPGMTVLGDIRQLQGMAREKGKAIKKMVDPPMVGSPELRTQKTTIISGDITYVRDPQHGFHAAHEVRLNLEHLLRDIQDVRYLIQRGFYEDLFLMLQSSDQQLGADRPTAREIEERHEEKLMALGPVLEQVNDEALDPIVTRTHNMMDRSGLLPDLPPDLDGVELKVEFTSVLHQALKLVGLSSLDRFFVSVVPLMQVDPGLRHKIDGNAAIDEYGQALSIPPRLIRSNEEARELQEAEAQQAAQMAEAKALADTAGAIQKVGNTPMGQGSALDALVGAEAGGTVQ
jgi:hypothetical protein